MGMSARKPGHRSPFLKYLDEEQKAVLLCLSKVLHGHFLKIIFSMCSISLHLGSLYNTSEY